ncbi:tol-pal system protein YbgF [Pseudahrensia aquimaris]|uniref:Tol-pal system protein YbgF n=1 Tax=Pseudahrensia aquimaris TaxID=744461 RepID=A0ABW3FKK9_9HYPH
MNRNLFNAVARLATTLPLVALFCAPSQATDFKRPAMPLGQVAAQPPVILAQSGDAVFRVNELEEQVRGLNGKVEELTFQLLQLQEELRRMQQDNELRFQELEERRGDAGSSTDKDVAQSGDDSLGKSETSAAQSTDVKPEEPASTQPQDTNQNIAIAPQTSDAPPVKQDEAPKTLGTLTFDDNGNVIDAGRPEHSSPGEKLPGVFSDGVDGGVEAAEFGPTPNAVFEAGTIALKNKRYKRAEQAMRAFVKAWPKDPKEGEALYTLAQALFWQRQYLEAANTHLDTHNAYPDASTAPENLLGLGLALAGLNQREVACVTYSEVLKQYPEAVNRLADRVQAEQAAAKCS